MTKRRTTILVLVVCGIACGVTAVILAKTDRLHAKPRREWKEQAIASITQRLNDQHALEAAVNQAAKTATTRPAAGSWVGEDVLVMSNGDWITYESICSKQDSRIHDLFIGRGSDGQWYYSTFHFCTHLTVLRHMENWQPDSLAQFAEAYWLAPFDGRSDECLKATWTGGKPYGLGRLQSAAAATPAP